MFLLGLVTMQGGLVKTSLYYVIKMIKNLKMVNFSKNLFKFVIRDHSSIMSSKWWVGGWGQKMTNFDDLQHCKSSKRWVGGPKKVKNMIT